MNLSFPPSIAFVGLILAGGLVQGLLNDRWRASESVENAVQKLDNVPMSFGDWRGESKKLDNDDMSRVGIKGHASIRYRNLATGDEVSVLLVCGRTGPIAVHTPDVCYGAAGYSQSSEMRKREISTESGPTYTVWTQPFKRPAGQAASQIEVNWVWMANNKWVAADNSRLTFAGLPALYKLYVVRELQNLESNKKRDSGALFLRDFLPLMERVFAPAPSP